MKQKEIYEERKGEEDLIQLEANKLPYLQSFSYLYDQAEKDRAKALEHVLEGAKAIIEVAI